MRSATFQREYQSVGSRISSMPKYKDLPRTLLDDVTVSIETFYDYQPVSGTLPRRRFAGQRRTYVRWHRAVGAKKAATFTQERPNSHSAGRHV